MSVLTLPLSLFYILWMSLHLFKDYDLSWVASFVAMVAAISANLLTFVAGIILTTGFKKWCALITSKEETSCEMGEFVHFDIGEDIDKSGYYVEFGMAQQKLGEEGGSKNCKSEKAGLLRMYQTFGVKLLTFKLRHSNDCRALIGLAVSRERLISHPGIFA
ncbi:hypothetical protein LSAT2_009505 [Lamellibrachia satsuma]|nr:hypothetical protein LSAT2_009505 [Lamellibrachia satsuma]